MMIEMSRRQREALFLCEQFPIRYVFKLKVSYINMCNINKIINTKYYTNRKPNRIACLHNFSILIVIALLKITVSFPSATQ